MDAGFLEQVKTLLQQLSERIPHSLIGTERQGFIDTELLQKIEMSDRDVLRSFLDQCLEEMRIREASDIDLGGWGSKGMIWLRAQGVKAAVKEWGNYTTTQTDILVQNILTRQQRAFLFEHRNLDFSYIFRDSNGIPNRNRADAYFDLDSLALNMRAINTNIRPYDGFGFHANVTRALSLEHTKEGLILITGITGSGKSSTLDAIVDMNNATSESHIVIIASPVEFVHSSKKAIIRHREVGTDTISFKHGTIEALRQDPDIIIIGEMRDPETIMAALEVADSGHKVLSTLHTSSAIESIDRIIGEVAPEEQNRVRNRLADVLRCVISQKLCPSLDGKRVLAKEIMIMTPSIRAAIKNNNTGEIYQMINEGLKYGMSTMEQDLKELIGQRKINKETAMSFANNKRMMQQLLTAM